MHTATDNRGFSMNARVHFCLIAVVGTLRDLFECIYIRLHTLIPMNKFSSRKARNKIGIIQLGNEYLIF